MIIFGIMGSGFAQSRKVMNLPGYDLAPYHFGFILGMNQMLFSIKTVEGFQQEPYDDLTYTDGEGTSNSFKLYSVESTPSFGFTIGIVSNLRLHDNWDLRFVPSLSFGQREINYTIYRVEEKVLEYEDIQIQSTFVEFPLSLKFKGSRYNNMRPYWLVGAKYALDLASDANKEQIGIDKETFTIARNDIYGELGGGLDFYTAFFKFGVEVKMSYGFNDLLQRQNNIYTMGIERLRSKLFLLSLTFE